MGFVEEMEDSHPKTKNFKGPKTSIISMIDSNLRSERDVLTTSQKYVTKTQNNPPGIQFTPRQIKGGKRTLKTIREEKYTNTHENGENSAQNRKREIQDYIELERKLTETTKKPKIEPAVDPMLWNPDVPKRESENPHKVSYNQQKGKNKIMKQFLKDVQAFHESGGSSNESEPEYVPGLYGLKPSFNC